MAVFASVAGAVEAAAVAVWARYCALGVPVNQAYPVAAMAFTGTVAHDGSVVADVQTTATFTNPLGAMAGVIAVGVDRV